MPDSAWLRFARARRSGSRPLAIRDQRVTIRACPAAIGFARPRHERPPTSGISKGGVYHSSYDPHAAVTGCQSAATAGFSVRQAPGNHCMYGVPEQSVRSHCHSKTRMVSSVQASIRHAHASTRGVCAAGCTDNLYTGWANAATASLRCRWRRSVTVTIRHSGCLADVAGGAVVFPLSV